MLDAQCADAKGGSDSQGFALESAIAIVTGTNCYRLTFARYTSSNFNASSTVTK